MLGRLPQRCVPQLAAALLPLARVVRRLGTPQGVLLLRAHDRAGAERDRVEVFALANGLDMPAAPVVWVVESLLAGGLARGGLLAPRGRGDAAAAIGWLREAGYEVREGGAPPAR